MSRKLGDERNSLHPPAHIRGACSHPTVAGGTDNQEAAGRRRLDCFL